MNHVARAVPALLGLLLAGCSPDQAATSATAEPPLAGARMGGAFNLTDQDGRAVTDRSFPGKWRVMYFGYTFCPDVCPVDAQKIGAGLRAFEARDAVAGAKVVPVFVTVDPERDTPVVLKQFVANFHPRMVGLTGNPQAIAAVAKAYGTYYHKGEPTPDGGGYMMDHSRQAVLFDPQGRPIAILPLEKEPADIAAELARWVR